jgi:3',5'-cyclic AMP phosphodiesterase CpdA
LPDAVLRHRTWLELPPGTASVFARDVTGMLIQRGVFGRTAQRNSRDNMPRLLHISDLHFGPPFLPRVGRAVLDLAATLQPDAVVISGDLTQRAKRKQFLDARDFMNQLPDVPRMVIPGNHDVPLYRIAERLRDPHGLYREIISPDLNQVLTLPGAILVGLDSTAPRMAISNGRVVPNQLQFCEDAFSDADEQAVRIVVAHHHFAPAPDYHYNATMPKARRAIDRFVDLGVEMILGGHLHRGYIGNSLDFFPGNHRDRGIIVVQCGTTTSSRGKGRERNKNSFNMVDVGTQMLTITHYMYFDAEETFRPMSQHAFPRPGRQFDPTAAAGAPFGLAGGK